MPELKCPCNNDALDGGADTHDCGHNHCTMENSGCIDHLKYERYRLQTFDSWPASANVNKYDLAKNGFYYLGPNDRVQCVYCKIILNSWAPGDIVKDEHRKHGPRCPFVIDPASVQNYPLPYRRLNRQISCHQGPLHREYSEREMRLMSFEGWSDPTRRPTPGELADAGFFYLGHGDNVKCYFCGGLLRDWEETDDPWEEHKKWFPLCLFVVEHDPSSHSDIQRHLRRTLSGIAIANGYSQEEIQGYKQFTRENQIPYPEEYRELVNQLEQYRGASQPFTASRAELHRNPSAPAPESTNLPATFNVTQGTKPPASKGNIASASNAAEEVSDRYLCKVCYERPLEMIFYPCKHVCCCQSCSDKLVDCPVCRTKIRGRLQIFFS